MKIPFFRKRTTMGIDPVCKMDVDKDRPPGGTYSFQDNTYYFCAPGCNRAFQKEPKAYISGTKSIDM